MKASVFRMLRSGVCLLLAICMVVGMCPVTAFAQEAEETEKVIKYVSLGDSMSNGYGLTEYDNNGFEAYGREAYPVQFADWLVANGYADEVIHYEYALSAMRAEDLHFVLEYPIDDPEAAVIADGPWNEEAWEAKFKTGDQYTWGAHTSDGRFWQNVRKEQGSVIGSTNDAAKKYQSAVAEADIISVGLGNANWGVFLVERIMNALGIMGGSVEKDSWIELEDALRDDCPKEIADQILNYANDLRAELVANEALVSALSVERVDALANAIIYTLVSYVLNYGGAIDRIVELNPDAEIVIVGLMNAMNGMEFRVDESTVIDLGEYMHTGLNLANTYLAALPTFMQAKGHWSEATFLYAEVPNVEAMVDKYADYIDEPGFDTIRKRFITEIVGENGDALVWDMFRPMVEDMVSGATLVPITYEQVLEYKSMDDVQRAAMAESTVSGNYDRNVAISCAIYLAIEDAVIASCDPANDSIMSFEGMLALQNLDADLFADVVAYFEENIDANGAAKLLAAATPVADKASQTNAAITKDVLAIMTANVTYDENGDEIRETGYAAAAAAIVKPGFAENEEAKYAAVLNHDGDVEALINEKGECGHTECAAVYDQYEVLVEDTAARLAADDGEQDLIGNVRMLSMLLALPETLSAGLQSEESIFGLLNLYARCLIGNGLGAHPSADGHSSLSAAVAKAYANKETASDKAYQEVFNTIGALYGYLRNYIIEKGAANDDSYRDKMNEALEALRSSDSYYVALGDSSAYGEATYVDRLAAKLNVDTYQNLAGEQNTVLVQMAALSDDEALRAEVAKADLITVGFSQVPMINQTVATLMNSVLGSETEEHDWVALVGEERMGYIVELRDKIYTALAEESGEDTAAMVTAAIEAYAYGVVAYACVIPEMVNAIHAINSDAVVVIVGMYNPLEGVSFDLDGQVLEFGSYLDYLVDAAQVHGTAYSMISGNAIYVNASDVETQNTDTVFTIRDLMKLWSSDCAALNPSDKDHNYIQKCIYDALFPSDSSVKRVFGENRYETSFAIANEMKVVLGIEKFDAIVLANSDNFADALAGSYLAAEKEAPIIIGKQKYASLVCEYLNENLASGGTVYILGGEDVMPESILANLTVQHKKIRLAGDDRYDTNLAILREIPIGNSDILIATGRDFADSLSASATGLPILLVNGKEGKSLTAEQKEFLATVKGDIYIIGGESAVPASMVAQIEAASGKTTTRIAGESRYVTSIEIAKQFLPYAGSAVTAYASTFPDGLCGGPLAYLVGAPLILTKDGKTEAPAYTQANDITSGYVLGGESLISDGFAMTIFQATEILK